MPRCSYELMQAPDLQALAQNLVLLAEARNEKEYPSVYRDKLVVDGKFATQEDCDFLQQQIKERWNKDEQ